MQRLLIQCTVTRMILSYFTLLVESVYSKAGKGLNQMEDEIRWKQKQKFSAGLMVFLCSLTEEEDWGLSCLSRPGKA